MSQVTAIVKKWGSSAAIILPADLMREEGLKVGDEVTVDIHHPDDWSDFFGAWAHLPKIDAQAFKDEIRREEGEAEGRKRGQSP